MAFLPRRRPGRRPQRRPPRWIYPRQLERLYVRLVSRIIREKLEESMKTRVLPMVEPLVTRVEMTRPGRADSLRSDAWPDEVALMRERMSLDLEETIPEIERAASTISVDLYKQNRNQWRRIQKAMIGVEAIGQNEVWASDTLQSWINGNVGLIKKLAQETATNVEGIVTRGLQTGLRVEEIRKQIYGRVPGTPRMTAFNRAKLIARDQVAKLNGQITQARQEELGVKRYVWRTSEDERVRGSHRVLNGLTCDWSNATIIITPGKPKATKRSSLTPAGYEGHPGQDYQCRCYAEPDLEEFIGPPE